MHRLFTLAILLLVVAPAAGGDWPQFGRDGSRNGVSPEKNPPTWWQFPAHDDAGKLVKPGRNVRWTAAVSPRGGFMSRVTGDPVVSGGLVWVGANDIINRGDDRDPEWPTVLVCLDEKAGKELYGRSVSPNGVFGQDGRWHSHGSSPCVEGDTLWVLTNHAEVVCLDIGPLLKRTGPPRERWVLDTRKTLGVVPAAALHSHRTLYLADEHRLYAVAGDERPPAGR